MLVLPKETLPWQIRQENALVWLLGDQGLLCLSLSERAWLVWERGQSGVYLNSEADVGNAAVSSLLFIVHDMTNVICRIVQ